MTTPQLFAVALAFACALAYLPLTARPESPLRSGVKTASVALLALAALSGGPLLLVVALAFCALGDWLLSRPGEHAFMAGVGAFAAGHLAYIALFVTRPDAYVARLLTLPAPVVIAGLIVLGGVMAHLLAPRAGRLKIPVLAYIPVILGMGVAALTLPSASVLLTALSFIASDLVLATQTFLLRDDHPAHRWTPYAVWPLYWGAQAGFWALFAAP